MRSLSFCGSLLLESRGTSLALSRALFGLGDLPQAIGRGRAVFRRMRVHRRSPNPRIPELFHSHAFIGVHHEVRMNYRTFVVFAAAARVRARRDARLRRGRGPRTMALRSSVTMRAVSRREGDEGMALALAPDDRRPAPVVHRSPAHGVPVRRCAARHPGDLEGLRMRPMSRSLLNREGVLEKKVEDVSAYVAEPRARRARLTTDRGRRCRLKGKARYTAGLHCLPWADRRRAIRRSGVAAVAPGQTDWYLFTPDPEVQVGYPRCSDPTKDANGRADGRGMVNQLPERPGGQGRRSPTSRPLSGN